MFYSISEGLGNGVPGVYSSFYEGDLATLLADPIYGIEDNSFVFINYKGGSGLFVIENHKPVLLNEILKGYTFDPTPVEFKFKKPVRIPPPGFVPQEPPGEHPPHLYSSIPTQFIVGNTGQVTLRGNNFYKIIKVYFSDQLITDFAQEGNTLSFTPKAIDTAQTINILVENSAGASDPIEFQIIDNPHKIVIKGITPNILEVNVGTKLVITGDNLERTKSLYFDEQEIKYILRDSVLTTAEDVKAYAEAVHNIYIKDKHGDESNVFTIQSYERPIITSVVPNTYVIDAPVHIDVLISGKNLSNVDTVEIGGATRIDNITHEGDKIRFKDEMTFAYPGDFGLDIYTKGLKSNLVSFNITKRTLPYLEKIYPKYTRINNPTYITINGENFDSITKVKFGEGYIDFDKKSDTELGFNCDAKAEGLYNIVAESKEGISNTIVFEVLHVAQPVITSVTPAQMDVRGLQKLTIAGSGLGEVLKGTLSAEGVPDITCSLDRESEHQVTVYVDKPPYGYTYDLVVVNSSYTSNALKFRVVPSVAPLIKSVTPSTIPPDASTEIEVVGSAVGSTTSASFSDIGQSLEYKIIDEKTINVTVPKGQAVGERKLSLTNEIGSGEVPINVAKATLDSFSPETGEEIGGESIKLFGKGLSAISKVTFGPNEAEIKLKTDALIEVIAPAWHPGYADIDLDGQPTGKRYYYFQPPPVP